MTSEQYAKLYHLQVMLKQSEAQILVLRLLWLYWKINGTYHRVMTLFWDAILKLLEHIK